MAGADRKTSAQYLREPTETVPQRLTHRDCKFGDVRLIGLSALSLTLTLELLLTEGQEEVAGGEG